VFTHYISQTRKFYQIGKKWISNLLREKGILTIKKGIVLGNFHYQHRISHNLLGTRMVECRPLCKWEGNTRDHCKPGRFREIPGAPVKDTTNTFLHLVDDGAWPGIPAKNSKESAPEYPDPGFFCVRSKEHPPTHDADSLTKHGLFTIPRDFQNPKNWA